MPADQRLNSDLLAGGKIELRLIDDFEFLAAKSEPQVLRDRASPLQRLVHAFLKEAHALAALGLGAGNGNVSVPQQFRRRVAVIGGECDAGANGAHELLVGNADGKTQRLGQAIDAGLERLVMRCLAKDPQDRPADAQALLEELVACEIRPWSWADSKAWWRKRDASHVAVTETAQMPTKSDLDKTVAYNG